MTQEHPITPPPELVEQWADEAWKGWRGNGIYEQDIAHQAARWGADQELEACINYFHEYDPSWGEDSELITGLRTARRPKPPSLKEQALMALEDGDIGPGASLTPVEVCIIRRALASLPD